MLKRLKNKGHNYVGRNILTLRNKMGWSQDHVSKKLEISIAAFSKIETGVTDTRLSRLKQIAKIFDLEVMDLFAADIEQAQPVSKLAVFQKQIADYDDEIARLKNMVIALYEELRDLQISA